jgi:hypothetical protein
MTTKDDDVAVMKYFWFNFLKRSLDQETHRLCENILDKFAAGSFYQFLKTTEKELIEYKELSCISSKITLTRKKQIHTVIEKIIRCQWYAFYTLYEMNLEELSIQQWQESTNYMKYSYFVNCLYPYVKKNNKVHFFKDDFMKAKVQKFQLLKIKFDTMKMYVQHFCF